MVANIRLVGALALGILLLVAQPVAAQNFSIDAGHADTLGGFPPPDDILGPGFPPFPVLLGGGGVDVDAFSMGHFGPVTPFSILYIPRVDFSVDALAVGAAGTGVFAEAGIFDAETDIFRSAGFGGNGLFHDGDGSAVSPGGPLGILEGAGAPGPTFEGLDAFDNRPPGAFGGPIYWSVDIASLAAPPYAGGSGADIFSIGPGPGFSGAGVAALWAPAGGLGLVAGDEIDAVEVYDVGVVGVFDGPDSIVFSLAPGSPSLGLLGVAPGDLLISGFGGFFGVLIPDVGLGLAPGDNLNALSITSIPEPGSVGIIGLMSCCLLYRRSRRST